ncbi:hypothetical protein GOP47_0026535 [Adiantum capillus-veneris]|nr:hypothetical protein GOP47_0026535 [Adiantum capillus-veneris]
MKTQRPAAAARLRIPQTTVSQCFQPSYVGDDDSNGDSFPALVAGDATVRRRNLEDRLPVCSEWDLLEDAQRYITPAWNTLHGRQPLF